MEQTIRIVIADDHPIVREGLQLVLAAENDIDVVGVASNGAEATSLAAQLAPDVLLLDLFMPLVSGIDVLRQVHRVSPRTRVLVLTSSDDEDHVYSALQEGAVGYLLKDALRPELLRAVRATARGEATLHPLAQQALIAQATAPPSPLEDLTVRELEVLSLIARGMSNAQIASNLNVTVGTIKGYVSIVLQKLDVEDRTQAALYAVRHGLAPE